MVNYDTATLLAVMDDRKQVLQQYWTTAPPYSCHGVSDCFETPLQNTVAMTTPYLAIIEALEETRSVRAVSSVLSLYNATLTHLNENGDIIILGSTKNLDQEQLVALDPGALFVPYTQAVLDLHDKLIELSIPILSITSHQETHPLGKAEWLKFFGVLFNRVPQADSIFRHIEASYLQTKERYQLQPGKPKVMAGYARRGSWIAPGGKSYFAQLLEDAGADYVFAENGDSGNITLSFERAHEIGLQADYLFFISMGPVKWELVRDREPLINEWPSVMQENVFSNDGSVNAQGGNDYWGKGFLAPDVILKDLVMALAPGPPLTDSLVYFRKPILIDDTSNE